MNILFTGASSFTGMWFVKQLALAGHTVTVLLKRPEDAYAGMRRARVKQLDPYSMRHFDISFGDDHCLKIIKSQKWDIFCHHAADVTDYKSSQFNVQQALANNTHNLPQVLETLRASHCHKIVLTGSVFEPNEGMGSDELRAVSPYGLSKGLTASYFDYYTKLYEMRLGKFVIPNPFGAFEEARFTSYLMNAWLQQQIPQVNTPQYVRDNIPVCLLANVYVQFTEQLSNSPGYEKCSPSFYAESQAEFTKRLAEAMRPRLNLPCLYELKNQTEFNEPLVRLNSQKIDARQFRWNEALFWDKYAAYYTNNESCLCTQK